MQCSCALHWTDCEKPGYAIAAQCLNMLLLMLQIGIIPADTVSTMKRADLHAEALRYPLSRCCLFDGFCFTRAHMSLCIVQLCY